MKKIIVAVAVIAAVLIVPSVSEAACGLGKFLRAPAVAVRAAGKVAGKAVRGAGRVAKRVAGS